jgi:hypothetical protein
MFNHTVKSPILLVKSKVSEAFLRQLFDLVPGLIEFGYYVSGCFQITSILFYYISFRNYFYKNHIFPLKFKINIWFDMKMTFYRLMWLKNLTI